MMTEDKYKKNILVAGGAGFIGSHLCDALLAKGSRVVCLDNLMRGSRGNIQDALMNPDFRFVEGDAADQDLLRTLLRQEHISQVFHLAANSDIQASAADPGVEYDITLGTTWSVLSAMRECGVKELFFASSSAVYGEKGDSAIREESTMEPISYYGAAKAGSEMLIRAFTHMNGMNTCVFRFANVVGPRLTHGVIFDFIGKLEKEPSVLQVLGNGTQSKPYIHVSDLLRALLSVAFEEDPGHNEQLSTGGAKHDFGGHGCFRVYNVGVESSTTVRRIAEMVLEEMELPDAEIRCGTEDCGWKGDVPRFSFDLTKIHGTGWRTSMTSDEAVRQTIQEVLRCRR